MQPIRHPRVTRRLGAPLDWDAEKNGPCGYLEIADVACECGSAMESFWQLDADELQSLLDGGVIVLTIHGQQHPVVSLGVTIDARADGVSA